MGDCEHAWMRYGHTESGTARKLTQQRKSLHQQSQIGTVLQLLAGGITGALSKTWLVDAAERCDDEPWRVTGDVHDWTVEEPLDYFQHVRTCVDIPRLLGFDRIQPAVHSVCFTSKGNHAEHKALDCLVLTDADEQGVLCMNRDQLEELRVKPLSASSTSKSPVVTTTPIAVDGVIPDGTLGYSDEEDQLQQASVHSLAAGCILPHKIPFIT